MDAMLQNTTIPAVDEKMDVVFVGHVDHGKSTVVGRLLADTGSLPQGKLEQVRLNCERNSRPFEYAFLIDALKDEASQNITIDAARVFFKSALRRYMILDAPGHIEFIKNMVTGAARAEAALLVIDAHEGVQENSRRHGYLLKMIGIRQIFVLINKMDLVDYQEETFNRLRAEYGTYLDSIGVKPLGYIPVSGREGDNIASQSIRMPWYQGYTVLSALDALQKAPPLVDQPLRMPVQDIYRFTLFGDSRRIVAGTISSGALSVGDEIVFYPSGKRSKVKTIEAFNRPLQTDAGTGQAVGFTLEEQIYIQRGEVATRAGETPPKVAKKLRASIFWLGKEPMVMRKQYLLKLGTAKIRAQIEKINQVQDAASGEVQAERTAIEHHEVAEVELTLQADLAFDLADVLPGTSRFVIVDQYEICGGGIVLAEVSDTDSKVRENVIQRNMRWIRGGVTLEQREERYSQHPALVLITGKQGVGRKRLAQALETSLFHAGRLVYYLGFGSVIYGVDADLKRNGSTETRHEHIRRLAEVAHILLDTGHILILTAVEFNQEDLSLLKTVINPEFIETVWVGEDLTTDIRFDLKVELVDNMDSAVTQIRHLLQEHGVVFRV